MARPGLVAVVHHRGAVVGTVALAVLGRGYAVAWNEDRTRVLRDAADTRTGDRIRVTLAKGELDCEVRSHDDSPHQPFPGA